MSSNKTFKFTLILKNALASIDELEDSLYEVGCDDALIHCRNSSVYLEFDRVSTSLEDAVISAIKDIQRASIIVDIVGVSPENLVTESEIARRLNKSRQIISLWTNGDRRDSFPSPIMRISEKSPLWSWSEVTKWLFDKKIITDIEIVDNALFIANINGALEERDKKTRDNRHRLLEKISFNDNQARHV